MGCVHPIVALNGSLILAVTLQMWPWIRSARVDSDRFLRFFSDPESQFYENPDPRSASPALQNTRPKEAPIVFRATGNVILSGLHVATCVLLHQDLELLLNFGSNRGLRGNDVFETVTCETETQ